MIKNDPTRKQLRRAILILTGLFLFIIAMMLIQHFNAGQGHSSSVSSNLLSLGNILLVLAGAMFLTACLFTIFARTRWFHNHIESKVNPQTGDIALWLKPAQYQARLSF